jgi:hypothetical protein
MLVQPLQPREFKLEKGLQAILGGRTYSNEEELTKELLLGCLIQKHEEVFAVKTFDANVQMLSGDVQFSVKIDNRDNSVDDLKRVIQKAHGTPTSTKPH